MKKLTKGSALIFSLIILTFLLAIAISVAQNAVTEKKSASTTGKSLQAFQVADSGSELFLKAIKEANSDDSLLEVLGSGCGDDYYEGSVVGGNYKIAFYNSEGDQINCSALLSEVDRIKSVGTFGNTIRAVDVAVAQTANAGITGGCFIDGSSAGDPITMRWGSGCRNNGTSTGGYCNQVADSGYECGTASWDGTYGTGGAACLCVRS